jgi:hypothetical protein
MSQVQNLGIYIYKIIYSLFCIKIFFAINVRISSVRNKNFNFGILILIDSRWHQNFQDQYSDRDQIWGTSLGQILIKTRDDRGLSPDIPLKIQPLNTRSQEDQGGPSNGLLCLRVLGSEQLSHLVLRGCPFTLLPEWHLPLA